MRLYVETNFLLEIALEQGEHAECSDLLDVCGDPSSGVTLAVPASSFFEAQSALRNKRRHVLDFGRAYDTHVSGQLSRIHGIAGVRTSYADLLAQLTATLNAAESRFYAASDRIREIGEVLPTDGRTIAAAQDGSAGLSYEDALVYAAIRSDASFGQTPTYFVTTDSDFANVKQALATRQCTMLRSFQTAVQVLRHATRDGGA